MAYKAHLFICTNKRASGESCSPKGADELRQTLKELCARPESGLKKGDYRINSAGCLDKCENGIAAVLYPSGEWFLNLQNTPADRERLLTAVKKEAAHL